VSDERTARVRSELLGALEALGEVAELVADGERAFWESTDRRQRIRYLWIVVGSRLKNYCQLVDIPRAAGELGIPPSALARLTRVLDSLTRSEHLFQLVDCQSSVGQNPAQGTFRQIPPGVDGHRRTSAVGMPHDVVAPRGPHFYESGFLQSSDDTFAGTEGTGGIRPRRRRP
jgi:hypothetical protein